MRTLKVILYSLVIAYGSLAQADSKTYRYSPNEGDLNSYFSSQSVKYQQIFAPKINFYSLQDSLQDEKVLLDDKAIKLRNEQFNKEINGSDINREIGGDIVGNGGGSLESFAYYFYFNLPTLIESALSQNLISFSKKEAYVLEAIRTSLSLMKKENKFIFASEKKYENFFFDKKVDKAPRMAKTGFDITYPIYINIDRAYEMVDQNPRLWITLLIHELGHQVGFADHTFLDQLGNKVVAATAMDTESIKTKLPDGRKVKITVQNYANRNAVSELYLTVGRYIMTVKDWESRSFLESTCGDRLFHDADVQNMHWEDQGRLVTQGLFELKAKGWIVVNCKTAKDQVITTETHNIEIVIKSGIGYTMLTGEVNID